VAPSGRDAAWLLAHERFANFATKFTAVHNTSFAVAIDDIFVAERHYAQFGPL
jgi:hypothetical protein